jgi:hypothetical protein
MEQNIIKFFQNQLYGSTATNLNFSKFGSDSYEEFEKIAKTQPSDWEYFTKEITYQRNSYGHRCKEIADLNSEFILFVGCSLTEGISLAIEDTYAYKLSKDLNIDYYNLGVSACGPDLTSLNISYWFKNIKRVPKFIVLQWPAVNRKFERIEENSLIPIGAWIIDRFNFVDEKLKQNFISGVDSNYFSHYFDVLRLTTIAYLSALNIPVIELFADDFDRIDLARDLTHPGIKSNDRIVSIIKSKLQLL